MICDKWLHIYGNKLGTGVNCEWVDDVVEVVRCKDCKHRPIDTQEEGNGFDFEFPKEYCCPGYCDDGYYSQRFNDDFYCAWGERADNEIHRR